VPQRSPEQKEIDLRKWAKTIFEDGSIAERRAMLQNVKSRLILKNKKLYLDTDEIPKTPEPSDEANLAIRRGKNLRRRWKPTLE
jgi:hypothetical protein